MNRHLEARLTVVAGLLLATILNAADPAGQTPAPPPAAGPQRSAADLEKLAAPVALHPDPLIAIILPAAVYPVEVVQAARFVKNTNNLARLDQQPWDDKVKAVAKFPDLIAMMDADLQWTVELGQAFLEQPMDLMNAIQALRTKAQAAGTLKTTPQQTVTVTNTIVERTYQNQIVYVTNTVVEVKPTSTEVVYVPSYNPSVVYVDDDDDEAAAAFISFGVGMAFGAAVWGDCDWHYGGCYWGHYPPPPPPYPPPYYPPPGSRPPPPSGRPPGSRPPGTPPPDGQRPGGRPPGAQPPVAATTQRWQPDQGRLSSAGAPSTASREARGWGATSPRPSQQPAFGRAQGPSTAAQPARTPAAAGPAGGGARPGGSTAGFGTPSPGQMPSSSRPAPSPAVSRPSAPPASAFGGVNNGSAARNASNRGSFSRSGGGRGGGRGGGGRR